MGFQTAIEKSFIALLNWTLWFWEQNAKYAWIVTFLAPQNRISMAHNLIDEPINAIPSNINPLLARFELKIFFKSISLPHCVRIDLSSIHHGRQNKFGIKKFALSFGKKFLCLFLQRVQPKYQLKRYTSTISFVHADWNEHKKVIYV